MTTETLTCSYKPQQLWIYASDESAMEQLGKFFAEHFYQTNSGSTSVGDITVFLNGNLGMGKTTLSRGIIRGFGHTGSVKSPTYTLVEPYAVGDQPVFHFDLYRLADPEELEYLGIRDYFAQAAVRLVEWPEKGAGILPQADLTISIERQEAGRRLSFVPHSTEAESLIASLRRLIPAVCNH